MSKENRKYNYAKDGFCLTEVLPSEFITNLKKILAISNFEKFELGNVEIKILSLDLSNVLVNKCLDEIIEIIHDNTKIEKLYLKNNFTNKVYLTEDDINSEHRNQKFHYDSYPSTKMMIYLSDNSEDACGSTMFLKGSAQSYFLKKINFLRNFYVPGKYGMKNNKELNELILNSEKVVASNNKYSGLIFNTDTVHCASKITKQNFTRLIVRFDFKQPTKLGVYLDNFYSRVSNIYSRVFN
ncbi:hypothetical protein N9S53_01465 [Candidatus Pelagibacter sp.]|nr:hypothetical protein [Candidatus Pelagibacter sp.]